jgi:hypothetical protein
MLSFQYSLFRAPNADSYGVTQQCVPAGEGHRPQSGYSVFRLTFSTLSCTSTAVTSGDAVLGQHVGVQHTRLTMGHSKMDTCKTQCMMHIYLPALNLV